MILISEKLSDLDARIVHTQHDEIIVEARDDLVEQVREIIKNSMEESFKQIIPEVRFVVEPRVGEAKRLCRNYHPNGYRFLENILATVAMRRSYPKRSRWCPTGSFEADNDATTLRKSRTQPCHFIETLLAIASSPSAPRNSAASTSRNS